MPWLHKSEAESTVRMVTDDDDLSDGSSIRDGEKWANDGYFEDRDQQTE